MTPQIHRHTSTASAISVLSPLLPKSISVLRVLQSHARNPACIVYANFSETSAPGSFVFVANVEAFPGSTSIVGAVHIYSSLDLHDDKTDVSSDVLLEGKQTLSVFLKRVGEDVFGNVQLDNNPNSKSQNKDPLAPDITHGPGLLFCGIHERGVDVLKEVGVVQWSNFWRKYLFSPVSASDITIPKLPSDEYSLGDVQYSDLEYVLSKTNIPRNPKQMSQFTSVSLHHKTKLIGWFFESVDGSFISLFVDEGYRGRGFAKVLALELRRKCIERATNSTTGREGGDDGEGRMWSHADVGVDNKSSIGVMQSIGGKAEWGLSWMGIDLGKMRGL